MPRYELLNNIDHKDIKVITDKSPALGDNVMYALVYPFEFRGVQAEYPIFLEKMLQRELICRWPCLV
jgi:hypothetical protein